MSTREKKVDNTDGNYFDIERQLVKHEIKN